MIRKQYAQNKDEYYVLHLIKIILIKIKKIRIE